MGQRSMLIECMNCQQKNIESNDIKLEDVTSHICPACMYVFRGVQKIIDKHQKEENRCFSIALTKNFSQLQIQEIINESN